MTPRMRGPCSTMISTTLRNAPGGTSLVPLIHAATTAGATPRYMAIGITPSAISAARWTARMWIRLPTRISTGGEDTGQKQLSGEDFVSRYTPLPRRTMDYFSVPWAGRATAAPVRIGARGGDNHAP